jgi:hypothetical protein
MALKLLAYEEIEGKGFYEENDRIYQVRPLYNPDVFVPVSREQMLDVIKRENYQETALEFPNITELVNYIRNAYIDNRGEKGLQKPSDEQLKRVFLEAGDPVLNVFIQKATHEWLPKGEAGRAEKLYRDLKQIPSFSSRTELWKATMELGAKIRAYERVNVISAIAASPDIEIQLSHQFTALAVRAAAKNIKLTVLRQRAQPINRCRMVACEEY